MCLNHFVWTSSYASQHVARPCVYCELGLNGAKLNCSVAAYESTSVTIIHVPSPFTPAVNPITFVDEDSISSTLLISWQYVVTIINSSDDRVYLNITTTTLQ